MTPHILQKIVKVKRTEVAALPQSPRDLSVPKKDFIGALLHSGRCSIIGEVKPKSPSQGAIFPRSSVRAIVDVYNKNADAISVLCDSEFFGGGYDLLAQVRSLTDKPIIAKEFIIDTRQIRCASTHGADAILLIAAILSVDELISFATEAFNLGLASLLEVHSEEEVRKAAEAYAKLPQTVRASMLIGINNRDLDTLEIDLAVTEKLAPLVVKTMPDVRGIISESGIGSSSDIERLRGHVDGFLIGTSILKSKDPAGFFGSLLHAHTAVKFCGMTNAQDIDCAEQLHADFIGFIFAPTSPRRIDLEQAKVLRPRVKHAKVVGVFVDMPKAELDRHITELNLDYVQLHGTPDLQLCQSLNVPVIQAFRGVPSEKMLEEFLAVCPYVLIDKEDGRDEADFQAISLLPAHLRSRVFLAGGLTQKNVSQAVAMISPFAVDCARCIEKSPGKKDRALMSSFLTALA